MAIVLIDNTGDRFAASVTIADLAQFSLDKRNSAGLSACAAVAIIHRDWPFEVESILAQNGKGADVLFRDGSHLSIVAMRTTRRKPVAHWRFDRESNSVAAGVC